MANLKHLVRGGRLLAALTLLSAILLIAASCLHDRGGSRALVDPGDPVIPIVPADDHGDTQADATDLALDSSIEGQIEEGNDNDYFRVEVTEATILTVYTTGSLDTVGELQASDGSILASDDDGGDGGNFRIKHDVGPDTYYVKVSSSGTATGNYVVLAIFDDFVTPDSILPLPPPLDDHGDTRSDATDLTLGISVQGHIAEGDDDHFRVQVTEAGTLTVYTTGGLDTVGELQASDGSLLAGGDDNDDGSNFRIEHDVGPGAYYIRVSGFGAATGDYVVLASFVADALPLPPHDHGDTRSDATDLALGSSVRGQIEEGDDEDYFRVQVTAAGTLAVSTTGGLDTVGELQAGDGNSIAIDDDSGDGLNFRIERDDVGPGTYYVKVSSYGTITGDYVVQASFAADELPPFPPVDDHGDTRSDATDLTLGFSIQGQIDEGDDDDYFRVQVTQAGTLAVYTRGDLDTVGELQASDGSILASDDDGEDGHNFRIERDVGPGAYYVRVSSYGTATGDYVVLVSFTAEALPLPPHDHGDTRLDATDLPLGSSVRGQIEEGDDDDYFRVQVTAAGTLAVYTTGSLDTVGELQAGDGSSIAIDDDGGDGLNFRIERDVGPGAYYVRVSSYGTNTGDYVVQASFADDDHGDTRSDATDLALESSVRGQIEAGDDDFFRVQVTEAGTLTVYTTGGLDTVGELQASDGSILEDDDDDGDSLNFRIEQDVGPGTYYIRVSSYDTDDIGSYVVLANFVAQQLPPPPPPDDHGNTPSDATDLALGSSVQGEIEEGNDDDFFTVQVTEAGTLTVYTTGTLDTRGELRASDGSILASDDNGGDGLNFRIEQDASPGTYYVRVRSAGTATGRYVVLARFVTDHKDESDTPGMAIDITGKGTATGYIDSAGDVDYFQMTFSEPSVFELAIDAPVGTEMAALDETGRVLASGVVPGSPGSQGAGTQGTASAVPLTTVAVGKLTLPPFLVESGKKLLIRVVGPAVGAALRNPYVVAAATAAATVALYIYFKRIELEVEANGEIRHNLREFFECRRSDHRAIEGCEFEFKITGELSVKTKDTPVPLTGRIDGDILYVSAPCEAEDGTAKANIEATLKAGDTTIKKKTEEFTVRVRQSEDCPTGLFGAVAATIHSECEDFAWGITTSGQPDETSAESAALSNCEFYRSSDLQGCRLITRFGSAYRGDHQCAAVVYGERTSGNRKDCRLGAATGDTQSAAQSNALLECRSGGFNCSIQRSEEGFLSYCAQ